MIELCMVKLGSHGTQTPKLQVGFVIQVDQDEGWGQSLPCYYYGSLGHLLGMLR